jgi:hypothetical protein
MVPEVRQAIQNIVAFKSYSDYNFWSDDTSTADNRDRLRTSGLHNRA